MPGDGMDIIALLWLVLAAVYKPLPQSAEGAVPDQDTIIFATLMFHSLVNTGACTVWWILEQVQMQNNIRP